MMFGFDYSRVVFQFATILVIVIDVLVPILFAFVGGRILKRNNAVSLKFTLETDAFIQAIKHKYAVEMLAKRKQQ